MIDINFGIMALLVGSPVSVGLGMYFTLGLCRLITKCKEKHKLAVSKKVKK
jgi:hypothetical protein